MKVALDATPLTIATGGIQRYTAQLHAALTETFPEDRFELMAPEPGRWWSTGLPRVLRGQGFSLFHGTDFAVPYLPLSPAVMTLHDLSPWRDEWRGETSSRVRRRTPWLLRLGLATMVITPTKAIRHEAIKYFGLASDRVVAVPHGVAACFRPFSEGDGHDRPRYLLTVGTQGRRKNIEIAIAAACAAGLELWVVGRGEWRPEPGVRFLGAVPEAELPALYSHAAAFLFPSHYEGFGLPLLEAMACGTPVITSRDAALVEVAGGAALHCDAADPRAWIEAIAAATGQRQDLKQRGLIRAAEFTWTGSARLTRSIYEEAICRHGR